MLDAPEILVESRPSDAGRRPGLVCCVSPGLVVLIVHNQSFQRSPNPVPIEPDDCNGLRGSCFVMTGQIRALDRR